MTRLLVVKGGTTFPALIRRKGDFDHWIVSGMEVGGDRVMVVDVCNGEPLPPSDEVSGVVIAGSHANVTDHLEWTERTAQWLRDAVEERVPVLGICYGHQLLAYAFGGEVQDNPRGREFGTVEVHLSDGAREDTLLGEFKSPIRVHVGHKQSVLRLPEGARVLGWSERDAHQAFVLGERAWGVQFHPEFDAEVVQAYVNHYCVELAEEGQDPDRIIEQSADTTYGGEILRRFAGVVGMGQSR